MTAVAKLPALRYIALGLIGLAFSCTLLFAVAPTAQAASNLTPAQISAIMGLLQAFDADQETINNVSAALNGGTVTPPMDSVSSFNTSEIFTMNVPEVAQAPAPTVAVSTNSSAYISTNQMLGAVAEVVARPFGGLTDMLSSLFFAAGLY